MKKILQVTISISLLLMSLILYSQKYVNNWHINDCDIAFKNDTVEVNMGIFTKRHHAVGSISDYEGNLLFYSDGYSVWNKNHELMPNGSDLGIPYGRRTIVVHKPDSDSLFYIFTVEAYNGDETSGLYYSVVNLKLNNGLGDVTMRGEKILDKTTNKITAVFHQNGKDIWVITHQFNSNKYYSYLVSASGISDSPVVSTIGNAIRSYSDGQLKASPDGKKIACSYDDWSETNDDFDLFDFNAFTGELSNSMSFPLPVTNRGADGLEFSPDATKLFVIQGGSEGESGLHQFNITGESYDEINSSRILLSQEEYNSYTVMQLAPNGKIYICKGGGGGGIEHLGVIENPNEFGEDCIVHENGLFLNGGNSFCGVTPSFIQNYFFKTTFDYDNTCQASPVSFKITNEYKLDSVRWYFGEGSTSTLRHPIFTYNDFGTYTVRLLAYYPKKCDTIAKQITINPFTAFDLGENRAVCYGSKISVPGNFESYLWNDGDTLNFKFIEQEGWYKTSVTNSFGCMSSDSIYMTVYDLPEITMPDTIILGDRDSLKLNAGNFYSYNWSTGDTTSFLYVKEDGWYSVLVENESGCTSSKSILVMQQSVTENENNSWKTINPKPSYFTGLDVCFINEREGFIINNNSLLKTTNSGNSWEIVMTLSSANCIVFKNSIGYIIGNNGTIYKSTHKGGGWNKLSTSFTDNLNAISLITEDTLRITSRNKLFSSNDAGLTWKISSIAEGYVNDSYFTNANTGHAACNNGTILKTVDGGINWKKTISSNSFPSDFFRIVFTNESIGFASREHNEIFKTTNGGETWQHIKSLDAIYDIHFLDDETGYLSGEHGVVYKTIDGGGNWQYISQTGRIYAYDLYGIFFINENEGYATGARGRILKTINGGNSWQEFAPTYNDISQFNFVSDSVAYLRVENEIYKTTDRAETLINMGAPLIGQKTGQFSFINENIGYAIAGGSIGTSSSSDKVYKTNDGGITWKPSNNNFGYFHDTFYCIEFINENLGFVSGGYNGKSVFRTKDAGSTWEKVESICFGQMQFLDSLNGYGLRIFNAFYRLYKTTNGGDTWSVAFEIEEDIKSFHFIDKNNGYLIGDNQLIYKTIDGGQNWEKLNIPYEYYTFIKFISKNVGFILDEDGKLYQTNDGGANWDLWTTQFGLKAVEIESDKIYIYGLYGKILENTISVDSASVKINQADSVTNVSAIVSGTVASNGATIDSIVFEYSDNYLFSNQIFIKETVNFDSSVIVSARLEELKSNTKYYYRIYAVQNGEKYFSNIASFNTLSDYDLNMNYVYEYSSDQARLTATIILRDTVINNIEFEYGTNDSYESSIYAVPNTVTGNTTSTVEAQITSLQPETRYNVRLKANYGGQDIYSNTISFRTTPEYAVNMYTPNISGDNISIQGYLRAYKDTITNIAIQYGKSRNYDNIIATVPDIVNKGEQQLFGCEISELDSSSVYFYRLCFILANDTIYGDERIISLNKDMDMVVLEAEKLSDSSVVVRGLINTYGKYLQNIKFKYGQNGEVRDSVNSTPFHAYGYDINKVKAVINGITPNSEYIVLLSANQGSKPVFSDTLTFNITGITNVDHYRICQNIKVYPNPTDHFVKIISNNPVSFVEFIDSNGSILFRSNKTELDISGYSSGIYFVKICNGENIIIRKIIKK